MRKKNILSSIAALLILSIIFLIPQHKKTILVIIAIILICYLVIRIIFLNKQKRAFESHKNTPSENSPTTQQQTNYLLKNSLITDCEKAYLNNLKKIIGPRYIIQPQINLASIINKKSSVPYVNELFRNIDFGIFDHNYKPLLLVEINDGSHLTNKRKERDRKVKAICTDAGIPLIVLWTKFGINEEYIKKLLSKHLTLIDEQPTENQEKVLQNTQTLGE